MQSMPGGELIRQRMDFLLLPSDRRIRLAGYEVFRFGAHELMQDDGADTARGFFTELLARSS